VSRSMPNLDELEFQMQFVEGKVVQITKPYRHYTTVDLFVVTANNTKTVSIAPLGGEGIGLRAPHRGLRAVPIEEVATLLAAKAATATV
jgi:hypothetical protein